MELVPQLPSLFFIFTVDELLDFGAETVKRAAGAPSCHQVLHDHLETSAPLGCQPQSNARLVNFERSLDPGCHRVDVELLCLALTQLLLSLQGQLPLA